MSAPVSSSIGMSDTVDPVSGFRMVTRVRGAGGSNHVPSYAGIGVSLADLEREVGDLLAARQPRADDPWYLLDRHIRDDAIHLGRVRQAGCFRQADVSIPDDRIHR